MAYNHHKMIILQRSVTVNTERISSTLQKADRVQFKYCNVILYQKDSRKQPTLQCCQS